MLLLLLLLCLPPQKKQGAWPSPSPSHSTSSPSPLTPSLSPVPVPAPVPVVVNHLDLARLAKAVNRLSYRGVACPVPASQKPGFCPPKTPPFAPPRPASDPLLSCELCAVTTEKHHRLYPPRNHQASPKRVGDARRILSNPTLNHRRADQQHCQKRLLDSGTRPAWPQGMIEIRGVWAILTSPSPSKGLGRDPLPFTSVVPR